MQRAHYRPTWAIQFGERVRNRRHELEAKLGRSISQQQLGELAGLHRTFVGHIEQGATNVTLRTIIRLAAALDLDPSELVQDLEPDPKDSASSGGS
jgi:transcriptional regulator with XRE-family HTH domain